MSLKFLVSLLLFQLAIASQFPSTVDGQNREQPWPLRVSENVPVLVPWNGTYKIGNKIKGRFGLIDELYSYLANRPDMIELLEITPSQIERISRFRERINIYLDEMKSLGREKDKIAARKSREELNEKYVDFGEELKEEFDQLLTAEQHARLAACTARRELLQKGLVDFLRDTENETLRNYLRITKSDSSKPLGNCEKSLKKLHWRLLTTRRMGWPSC